MPSHPLLWNPCHRHMSSSSSSSSRPEGCSSLPGIPEVQAGGRLSSLLPGIRRPQPGSQRSGAPRWQWRVHRLHRRNGGPGRRGRRLRRLRRLPEPRLLSAVCIASRVGWQEAGGVIVYHSVWMSGGPLG